MLSQFVKICKDPENVARIQKYFGVEILDEKIEDDGSQYDEVQSQNSARRRIENKNKKEDLEVDENQNSIIKNKDAPTATTAPSTNKLFRYTITNHYWYYLFLFGTELADKQFCTMIFPFLSWNIDSVVGRRAILVFAITLTISKWIKDTVRWPRPASPPAARIVDKRSDQFGMPSIHASVGFSISFGVVLIAMDRYVYSITIACILAALWCTLIALSRVYLGMHTVLDVLAGMCIAALVTVPLVPWVDTVDYYLISTDLGMAVLAIISIAIVVYYPSGEDCHSSRTELALALSLTVGIWAGAWLNHKTSQIANPSLSPPYDITWPSCQMLLHMALRMIFGNICISFTRAVFKFLSKLTATAILRTNEKTLGEGESQKLNVQSRNVVIGELFYVYVAWFMVGLNIIYLTPKVFKNIGIERAMFHQEL